MLADIYQALLPQKRLNRVLQFGYAPFFKRVVIILYIYTYYIYIFQHVARFAGFLAPPITHRISKYAIYGNISHQYTPNVSIYTSTMDPMGYNGTRLGTFHGTAPRPSCRRWAFTPRRRWKQRCRDTSWSSTGDDSGIRGDPWGSVVGFGLGNPMGNPLMPGKWWVNMRVYIYMYINIYIYIYVCAYMFRQWWI